MITQGTYRPPIRGLDNEERQKIFKEMTYPSLDPTIEKLQKSMPTRFQFIFKEKFITPSFPGGERDGVTIADVHHLYECLRKNKTISGRLQFLGTNTCTEHTIINESTHPTTSKKPKQTTSIATQTDPITTYTPGNTQPYIQPPTETVIHMTEEHIPPKKNQKLKLELNQLTSIIAIIISIIAILIVLLYK